MYITDGRLFRIALSQSKIPSVGTVFGLVETRVRKQETDTTPVGVFGA